MSKLIDITGQKFNKLTVICRTEKGKWLCKCDCGTSKEVQGQYIRNGHTKSCGCLRIEVSTKRLEKHGMSHSDEYMIWESMIQRCTNPSMKYYAKYGGKGVTVCRAWIESFEEFLNYVGPRPSKKHSIDRIKTDGNYEPGNIRWATMTEQNRNKGMLVTNSSGSTGVSKTKRGKYHAYINVARKMISLGLHDTLAEASEVRRLAELKYWGKSS